MVISAPGSLSHHVSAIIGIAIGSIECMASPCNILTCFILTNVRAAQLIYISNHDNGSKIVFSVRYDLQHLNIQIGSDGIQGDILDEHK